MICKFANIPIPNFITSFLHLTLCFVQITFLADGYTTTGEVLSPFRLTYEERLWTVGEERVNRCIIAIKKGDVSAVEELHGLIAPTLRFIALKYVHDEFAADDLVQEFWKDIDEIVRNFVFVRNGFGYLCKAMTYRTINYCKKVSSEKKRVFSIDYVDYREISRFSSDGDLGNAELRVLVEKAMDALTPRERLVLQDIFFEDKSIREIAKEINVSKSTAENIKQGAIAKMKKELDKSGL